MSNIAKPVNLDHLKASVNAAVETLPTRAAGEQYLRFTQTPPIGRWSYGAEGYVIEGDERFVINANSLQHGWILWTSRGDKKQAMAPISQPHPDQSEVCNPSQLNADDQLSEGRSFRLVDLAEGTSFIYETNTLGGRDAWGSVLQALAAQLQSGETQFIHPVVELGGAQPYTRNGRTVYKPAFNLIGFADEDGNLESETPKLAAEVPEEPVKKKAPARRRRRAS